jgi:hypothetical protein
LPGGREAINWTQDDGAMVVSSFEAGPGDLTVVFQITPQRSPEYDPFFPPP